MTSLVRVGFLGAGLIATYHSKSLRRGGAAVERAGVFDPDVERADAFARASGHAVCASETEVLDSCDAVYVCTWTSEHPRLVAAAVARGIHVFSEKPLATNLTETEQMCRQVAAAGITHQVGLVLRRSPAFRLAKLLVDEQAAGEVMSVVFRDDQFIPVQGHYGSSWRADRTKAGSGTLLEHSIHDVDLLRWLVGDIDSVSAHTANRHRHEGIEDVAAVTMRFHSGALGTLTSVWHDNLARPSLRRVEIFCERRYIVVDGDDWTGPVTWTDADGAGATVQGDAIDEAIHARASDDWSASGGNPDVEFIRAIVEGHAATPGFDVALRAHQAVDAMYRSAAAAGSPISVPVVPRSVDVPDV
jgi:predicted dehydrogenase